MCVSEPMYKDCRCMSEDAVRGRVACLGSVYDVTLLARNSNDLQSVVLHMAGRDITPYLGAAAARWSAFDMSVVLQEQSAAALSTTLSRRWQTQAIAYARCVLSHMYSYCSYTQRRARAWAQHLLQTA